MRYRFTVIILLIAVGAAAGVINGLIGCGGGIVIVYALSYFYKNNGGASRRDIFATAVASILPMSAVSAFLYAEDAGGLPDGMAVYLVPAVFGGLAGAFLLDKINQRWIGRIFSLLVIWAGVSLVLKGSGIW